MKTYQTNIEDFFGVMYPGLSICRCRDRPSPDPVFLMEMSRRWSLESVVPCKSGEESTHTHGMVHYPRVDRINFSNLAFS